MIILISAVCYIEYRIAAVLSIPAWLGFIHSITTAKRIELLGVSALFKYPEIITVVGLICSLLSSLCASAALDDITDIRGWLFVILCGTPFIGIMILLDPLGMVVY